MIQAFLRYLRWLNQRKQLWLDGQFFEPILSGTASACRLAIGTACLLFFCSWYDDLGLWVGEDGPLNVATSKFLMLDGVPGSGSFFRLSPFFLSQSFGLQIVILLAGTLASLVLVSGFGGRVVPLIVWALILCVLHRVSAIQTLGELLLCSIVPYLAIDNGWLTQPTRVGFADNEVRWTSRLMIGMLRWHLILWLLISFASTLSQDIWWNGTALWHVAVNEQSPWLSPSWFADHLWLSPLLGGSWLLFHLMFIVCLAFEKLRPVAIPVGVLFWFGVYFLSGDMLYAVVGMAATSCVFYESTLIVTNALASAEK